MSIFDWRKADSYCAGKGFGPFPDHDRDMRKFRASHAKIEGHEPVIVRPYFATIPLPTVELDQFQLN